MLKSKRTILYVTTFAVTLNLWICANSEEYCHFFLATKNTMLKKRQSYWNLRRSICIKFCKWNPTWTTFLSIYKLSLLIRYVKTYRENCYFLPYPESTVKFFHNIVNFGHGPKNVVFFWIPKPKIHNILRENV